MGDLLRTWPLMLLLLLLLAAVAALSQPSG
jgi:hypothetical protein